MSQILWSVKISYSTTMFSSFILTYLSTKVGTEERKPLILMLLPSDGGQGEDEAQLLHLW